MDLSSSGYNDRLGSLSKNDSTTSSSTTTSTTTTSPSSPPSTRTATTSETATVPPPPPVVAAIVEETGEEEEEEQEDEGGELVGLDPPIETCGEHFVQRCIIIQRDEKGYGLTVSGDNPVFVQSVKEEGAAARAGVQRGDRIIKVNGTLVTQSNHLEVVKLIKSGSYVALTLLSRLKGQQQSPTSYDCLVNTSSSCCSHGSSGSSDQQPFINQHNHNQHHHHQQQQYHHQLPPHPNCNPHHHPPPPSSSHSFVNSRHHQQQQQQQHLPNSHSFPSHHQPTSIHHHHHGNMNAANRSSSLSERITAPVPVDAELQQELNHSRHQTMLQMLEQEKDYLEKIRCAYARTPTSKLKVELRNAQKLIASLENQVLMMRKSQPENNTSMASPPVGLRSSLNLQDPPPPPPPPRRHISLPHQSSLPSSAMPPVPPVRVESKLAALSNSGDGQDPSSSVVASPGSPPQYPISHSIDNIQRLNALASSTRVHSGSGGGGPSHSRQRSSPDAILHLMENSRIKQLHSPDLTRSHSDVTSSSSARKLQSSDSDLETKRRRTIECSSTSRGSSFGACDSASTDSPRVTPPGTPPPPYGSFDANEDVQFIESETVPSDESPVSPPLRPLNESGDRRSGSSDSHAAVPSSDGFSPVEGHPYLASRLSQSSGAFGNQQPIISMEEDDDFPLDGELGPANDHGPYKSLRQLCYHSGHLSVFIHFLITNSDPSSLFFYLISCMYKEGNAKDMRKWAYEIHSTFLVPGAPLKVNNIDEGILHEIDSVLQNDLEKEDVLRNIFEKARQKAMIQLDDLLAEFRSKRTLGLGGIFGPPDQALREAIRDKAKETKIVEQGLLPLLEAYSEDLENAKDRDSAIASSLASLLYKLFSLKSAQAMAVIERCPLFVARDTRYKGIKFLKGNKKNFQLTMGHHFNPQHYFNVTYCNHCQLIIWGIGNQGFQCQYCDMNIHKGCVRVIEETCIGARSGGKKDKKKDRVAGLVENIIGKSRKPSQNAADKQRRLNEESGDGSTMDSPTDSAVVGGDKPIPSGRVDKLCKTFEPVNENDDRLVSNHHHHRDGAALQQGSGNNGGGASSSPGGASPSESSRRGSQVVRSESLRTRRENNKPSFRKRSDPNIPRSNSDVDGDDRPVSGLNQSGSSSNSSISSKSLDSPSNSLEAVHRPTDVSPLTSTSPSVPPSVPIQRRDENDDSDFDVEPDPPNWTDFVDPDVVRHIKPKEKKRQDVINELIHTERTHVRNLKVLERVFHRPMQAEQVLPPDQIKLLFANLEEIIKVHSCLNSHLKSTKQENKIVGDVGDILLQMFDGTAGETFREAAATFCKNQSIALEALKVRQKKDQKLAQFLADASANALCRRFQLKDIIPTGMQRLTKYPLLLENLAKYTCPTTDEHRKIMRALDCSKDILNYVNQAVKEAENYHRVIEIQKKIDRGAFDKISHPISQEFRNLDLTRHKMQHIGHLTWRIVRQKAIEVQVLLMEDILVLLQKQDEKFVLKYHSISLTSGREETKLKYSPIIKLNNLLTRNVATDKKAFFLVSTSPDGPQIYELVAMSSNDRKTWLRHISEATEAYKARDGKNKRPEHLPNATERRESTEDASGLVPTEEGFKSPEALDNQESHEIAEGVSDIRGHLAGGAISDSALLLPPPPISPVAKSGPESGPGTASEGEDGDIGGSPLTTGLLSPQGTSSPFVSSSGASSSSATASPSPRRHFQRVEILQIAEGPSLIDPNEVVVSEGAILQTAEPVLAPIEKLRRKDQVIRSALQEKLHLVAEILHIPPWDGVSDELNSKEVGDQSIKGLVMAAVAQAIRLDKVIEGLKISEEDTVTAGSDGKSIEPATAPAAVTASTSSGGASVSQRVPSPNTSRKAASRALAIPVGQLVNISSTLSSNLTQLLALVAEREDERERLRKELRASHEQIHLLHEASRRRTPLSQSPSHSRPNSFVSIGSSNNSELCDATDHSHGAEDEALLLTLDVPTEIPSTLEAYNKLVSMAMSPGPGSVGDSHGEGDECALELFVDASSESCTDSAPNLKTEVGVTVVGGDEPPPCPPPPPSIVSTDQGNNNNTQQLPPSSLSVTGDGDITTSTSSTAVVGANVY